MTEKTLPTLPVVMTFSGHDPSGGAGIQADIEAILSMGCHATPVITSLTVQNTVNAFQIVPIDSQLIQAQARAILEDMPVCVFKIGLLSHPASVEAVHKILTDYPDIPVVLDPVLVASGGASLAGDTVAEALKNLLIPRTTILTPNALEAKILGSEADSIEACAQQLLSMGAQYVLMKGGDLPTKTVINTLFSSNTPSTKFEFERLSDRFHGSGCTLASAIAALLAQGSTPYEAVEEGLEYTWLALEAAFRIGLGQLIPNRLFWVPDENEEETYKAANDEEENSMDEAPEDN